MGIISFHNDSKITAATINQWTIYNSGFPVDIYSGYKSPNAVIMLTNPYLLFKL